MKEREEGKKDKHTDKQTDRNKSRLFLPFTKMLLKCVSNLNLTNVAKIKTAAAAATTTTKIKPHKSTPQDQKKEKAERKKR